MLTQIAAAAPDPVARAHAQRGAGVAANENGQPERAAELARDAVAGFTDDPAARCSALALLGNAYKAMGDYGLARTTHAQCLALARTLAGPRAMTVALNNLGTVAEDLGEYEVAARYLRLAAGQFRVRGEEHGLSFSLAMLAQAELGRGEPDEAARCAEEALRVARRVEFGHGAGLALARLGDPGRPLR